jgi:hypothetical protein
MLHTRRVRRTDDELDARSRELLTEIDELKRLEQEKRRTGRSTDEFHALADEVDAKARHVFNVAQVEAAEGEQESPIGAEQAEQHGGDWTEGSRN